MKFGYTIIYVEDVVRTVEFYERAFGLKRRFVHESGLYAEMETGGTALAFAGDPMIELNGLTLRKNKSGEVAAGIEIGLVADDVEESFTKAVAAGAESVKKPEQKPWGQVVSYVKDLNGVLVEICSEIKPQS